MSAIRSIFKAGHKALIGYVTAGYPNMKVTEQAASVLARSGWDLLELGIPFSDPLADGATIQRASYHALQNGTTPETCLEVAARIHATVQVPLVFMTYYNPVLSYGPEKFCRAAAKAGVSGLIVPDLPPEEGGELEAGSVKCGLDLIYLLAPTSSERRIQTVAERSRGFIYLVSLTGVTGARQTLPADLEEFVSHVRRHARQPVCIGFGISSAEQARRVAAIADGVIVGSRLIQLIEEDATLASLAKFAASLRKALDRK